LNAAVLRPLPVMAPSDLVTVYQTMQNAKERFVEGSRDYLSYEEYTAYRDRNHSFEGLAAYASVNVTLGGDENRRLNGQLATCNYFDLVTKGVAVGRGFSEEECRTTGASPVAIISHNLWKRQFDTRPDILGQRVLLNGFRFTIVGVAPAGFTGGSLQSGEIWA